MHARCALASFALSMFACGAPATPPVAGPETDAHASIEAVLDDWHAAAAASDEERYFDHMSEDSVFLGTDATERWTKPEFRAYAHPHFAAGHGWVFRPLRRAVMVAGDGTIAWFDEDLEGAQLGPARGSGVLRRGPDGVWRIAHYVLSLTIPNPRFHEVRCLLTNGAAPGCDGSPASDGGEGAEQEDTSEPERPEVTALRRRLQSARTPTAIWALASPERGLDVDLAHSIGHFALTACSVEEMTEIDEELRSWSEGTSVEGLSIGALFALPELACDRDLTRCVSCRADLSNCDGQTLFELEPGPDGEPQLYGVVSSFTSGLRALERTPTSVDDLHDVDVGQAAEVGVKCAVRQQLAVGRLSRVRVERHELDDGPARVSVLRGRRAARFGRMLARSLDVGAYCDAESCHAESDAGVLAIFYQREPDGRFTLPVVTVSEQVSCDGCFAFPIAQREAQPAE